MEPQKGGDLTTLGPSKCWLGGLLVAWFVQIFGTSALVATVHGEAGAFPAALWRVADGVAPLAKISFVLLLALLLVPLRGRDLTWSIRLTCWTIASAIAVLLVLSLLPVHLSRGFGVGLTGTRFDPALLPLYLSGAMVAGVCGALIERRCQLTGTAAR